MRFAFRGSVFIALSLIFFVLGAFDSWGIQAQSKEWLGILLALLS